MLDGSVDPATIHIEGLETEEQKRKKEVFSRRNEIKYVSIFCK